MKTLFTVLGTFLTLGSILAQNEVSGKLMQLDESVPYANVILKNAQDSSIAKVEFSDDDGNFNLMGMDNGSYFLELSAVSLSTYYSDIIELQGEKIDLGTIEMKSDDNELAEVTVVAQKPLVEVLPDRTVFNVSTSEANIGNNGMELLRKAPGIIVDNNNNIIVQGRTGVRVYINDKPSPLEGNDLVSYLQSLQSSDIEAIEVISDPSSKYDAEGTAGIINIRLLKDSNLGTNGSVNLGWRVGTFAKYNAGLRLNHKVKGANFYGSWSNSQGKWFSYSHFDRTQNNYQLAIDEESISKRNENNFRVGADINIGKNGTLGALVSGVIANGESGNSSTTVIDSQQTNEWIENLAARNDVSGDKSNINYNLNYQYRLEDKLWNVDVDYGTFNKEEFSNQPNHYTYPVRNDSLILNQSDAITDISIFTAKIDHERNIGQWKMESGLKTANITTENQFDFYDATSGVQVLDIEQSNDFDYTENVNAAYVNFSSKSEKWGYQMGLRLEQTNSEGTLYGLDNTIREKTERSYVDLFPSGGITYNINEKNTVRYTFSRRIDRPNYEDLNPFEMRVNQLSFRRGNPKLNPQYTNSMQLAWTHNYTWNFSLGYAKTKDVFAQIFDNSSDKGTFIMSDNIAEQDNISFNVSKPFTINKWWSNYTNLSSFYSKYQSESLPTLDVYSASIFTQNTFTLNPKMSMELSGFYSTPSVWGGTFRTDRMWGLDVGFSWKILKDKGSLKVAVTDILKTMKWSGDSDYRGIQIVGNGGWEAQQLKVNFSYNFGNEKLKTRNRKTGLEEESKRAS